MNHDRLLDELRHEGTTHLLSEVLITAANAEVRGVGLLKVVPGEFVLDVTVPRGEEARLPELKAGVVWQDQFWKVEGTIGDSVEFAVPRMPPPAQRTWGIKGVTLRFDTNYLDVKASGFDAMTTLEMRELQKQLALAGSVAGAQSAGTAASSDLAQPEPQTEAEGTTQVDLRSPKVSFDLVLPDFELLTFNASVPVSEQDEFLGEGSVKSQSALNGEVNDWRFSLVQRGEDLHVSLRSKPDFSSTGEEQDRHRLTAFLGALAFTHGQHAYPLSLRHRRAGKLVLHRVQLQSRVTRTSYTPFNRRLAYETALGHTKWDFPSALQKAYAFFCEDSKLAAEVTSLLHLAREAGGNSVPWRIRSLALCVLFESLLQVICEERIPLRRTGRLTAREKMQAVVEHLGLTPPVVWDTLFDQWKNIRDPLSHRISERDYSRKSIEEEWVGQSRIAGGLNCMVLRLMGYAGPFLFSAKGEEFALIRTPSASLPGSQRST